MQQNPYVGVGNLNTFGVLNLSSAEVVKVRPFSILDFWLLCLIKVQVCQNKLIMNKQVMSAMNGVLKNTDAHR